MMEILTIIAIITGPVTAVIITLWSQGRREKLLLKNQVFTTLMAQRGFPTSPEWIRALNLIDVVFENNPKVLKLWHEYYDLLHHEDKPLMIEQWERKKLELLSEIAKDLGYKGLQQIDIDKVYIPKGYLEETDLASSTLKQLLNVLTQISTLLGPKKDDQIDDKK